jgi:uncharacterized protein YgiM (DUF1202 family)
VTWPEGLSLRGAPSYDAEVFDGVDYNEELVVLEENADGIWQKVWVRGKTGWIKAGNVAEAPAEE